jgi:hypothetical protein
VQLAGETPSPAGSIAFDSAPIAVGFDIFWRSGDVEWRVGSVAAPAARGWATTYGHDAEALSGFAAREVDIILRSNPAAAASAVGIVEIWKGELVFQGAAVEWPPAPGADRGPEGDEGR